MLPAEITYFDCTVDPHENLQKIKNYTIDLATLQLHDWKQKLFLKSTQATHNYIEVHKFPSYAYDYTDVIPLYGNITICFGVKTQLYCIQIQQEMTNERGFKYLEHRSDVESNSLKEILHKALKLHQKIANEVEADLFPNFDSLLATIKNKIKPI